jgi:hypothetical protein
MKTYKDIDKDSGITAYDYGDVWIKIQFKSGQIYEYYASKIGQAHISAMKTMADAGEGLNSYIRKNPTVRNGWSSRT